MILVVIENADRVSESYHEEGGVLVVAQDEESARAALAAHGEGLAISDGEWARRTVYRLDGEYEAKVVVFPNAGCC